jgi:hypothetical protein
VTGSKTPTIFKFKVWREKLRKCLSKLQHQNCCEHVAWIKILVWILPTKLNNVEEKSFE